MKYAVIIIFKNGMKLDKVYDKRATAYRAAHEIGIRLFGKEQYTYFANTFFKHDDVLCVTWQEVKEDGKS